MLFLFLFGLNCHRRSACYDRPYIILARPPYLWVFHILKCLCQFSTQESLNMRQKLCDRRKSINENCDWNKALDAHYKRDVGLIGHKEDDDEEEQVVMTGTYSSGGHTEVCLFLAVDLRESWPCALHQIEMETCNMCCVLEGQRVQNAHTNSHFSEGLSIFPKHFLYGNVYTV